MQFLKSLSLKITVSILSAVFLIFTAIIIYNYLTSYDLLLRNVEQNVRNLGAGAALKIENILTASEKIPENLSYTLESSTYSIEDIKDFQRNTVEMNEGIFGCCIAFEPYAYDSDSLYFAPYTYHHGSGIAFKYLNSREQNTSRSYWVKMEN